EHLLADRIELEAARRGIGDDDDGTRRARGFDRRVAEVREALEDREIRERSEYAAADHDRLAADAIGKRTEDHEERRRDQERAGDQQVRRDGIDLERLAEEEQRIKLAAVPHHGLSRRRAEQREQHDLEIVPAHERFLQRGRRPAPLGFHLLEQRRFLQLQADVDRNQQQEERQPERDAPAPGLEIGARRRAAEQDHDERQEEAERRGDLDEARVEAALSVRRVLGHVGRCTAVLAAERKALQQAQRDQDDRRRRADRRIARDEADQERRGAHDHDRDQERVFAADEIAEAAEQEGAERPHEESGGEGE